MQPEGKGRRKDGEIFDMEISVCVIPYQGKQCCMAFLSDISKCKKTEEALGRTSVELGLWPEPKERKRLIELAREEGGFREQEVILLNKNGVPLTTLWSADFLNQTVSKRSRDWVRERI